MRSATRSTCTGPAQHGEHVAARDPGAVGDALVDGRDGQPEPRGDLADDLGDHHQAGDDPVLPGDEVRGADRVRRDRRLRRDVPARRRAEVLVEGDRDGAGDPGGVEGEGRGGHGVTVAVRAAAYAATHAHASRGDPLPGTRGATGPQRTARRPAVSGS